MFAVQHCGHVNAESVAFFAPQVMSRLSSDLAISVLRAACTPFPFLLARLPESLHALALRAHCPSIDRYRSLHIRHVYDPITTLLQVLPATSYCYCSVLLYCSVLARSAKSRNAQTASAAPHVGMNMLVPKLADLPHCDKLRTITISHVLRLVLQ